MPKGGEAGEMRDKQQRGREVIVKVVDQVVLNNLSHEVVGLFGGKWEMAEEEKARKRRRRGLFSSSRVLKERDGQASREGSPCRFPCGEEN